MKKKISNKLFLLCILSMFFIFSLNTHNAFADYLGDINNPFSIYENNTFEFDNYSVKAKVELKLLEYKEDEEAWDFIYNDNEYIDEPTYDKHWLLFKFSLKYISGTPSNELLSAFDVIDNSCFYKPSKSSLKTYDYIDFDNVTDVYDVELYPGTSDTFYYAILVDKDISYPMIRVNEDYYYDSKLDKFIDTSIWFNTNPNYKQPVIVKQTPTITAYNCTRIYGSSSFKVTAKTNSDGSFSYSSSNTKVAKIDSKGYIKPTGCGKAYIYIKVKETNLFKSVTKKITIIVTPSKVSSITVTTPKSKTIKIVAKKHPTASGYQYQYATNKSFKNAKTLKGNSTQTSKTVSKLKSKTYYYVRIRAYKVIDGKYYYGKWSSIKKIKTK